MIENAQNKDMAGTEPMEVSPVPMPNVDSKGFFFSGGGEFYPMTVNAADAEKATEIFIAKRVPLKPETKDQVN